MQTPDFDFPEGYTMRRGRLLTSGIIFGLMGALFCLTPASSVFQLVIMGTVSSSLPADEASEIESMQKMMRTSAIINILFYGSASIFLLFLAYGSIFLKRWARPLALIASWLALYIGVVSMFSMFAIKPIMEDAMAMEFASAEVTPTIVATGPPGSTPSSSSPPSPPVLTSPPAGPPPGMGNFMFIFMAIMISMFFVFGVLLPVLLIWLNWSQDIKATLEFCDKKPRWTDPCPIPVLGISVVAAIGAISTISSFFLPWAPFFGQVLTGNPARLFFAAVLLILVIISITTYHRMLVGWVLAVLLIVVGTVSAWITFPAMDMTSLYVEMGMPQDMVDEMMGEDSPFAGLFAEDSPLRWGMLFGFLPFLIYLGWALRFFLSGKNSPAGEAVSPGS